MKEFERCKEERFFSESKVVIFLEYLQAKCQTSFDFVLNKKILFDLTSYILVSQLK